MNRISTVSRHDARYASALEIIRTNRFPCRGNSNRRLFDFWVNDWDVSSQGQSAGTNDVQLILGDCVVFEKLGERGWHIR